MKKITTPSAAEICQLFKLSAAGQPLLEPAHNPGQFLGVLIAAGHFTDAVRFLAHALPKREAVWWACLAARGGTPPGAPPEVEAAIQAAEAWVFKPTEENRRAAMAKAEAARFEGPASWAAVGAFWSGGSMAPPEAPVVPPQETFTAAAVTGAVMLAAVQHQPERQEEHYREFLRQGVDIAMGGSGRPAAAAS